MTILQDSGYRIQAADKDTGLITATASTKAKMTWVPFVGFGKSKKTPVVSAYIEDRGAGSRIRLSFVMAKTKSGIRHIFVRRRADHRSGDYIATPLSG